ncbi:MAG: EF-P lysine aminoacylase EpmA [Desulfobacterales bacterium]
MNKTRQSTIIHNLDLRSRILQAVRSFFYDRNYLEVETPVRIPAPAPEAHIDAFATDDWYLQTSPELNMKRLLAAGCPKIFQICKCFRKGERGRRHLSELTMLEWYCAGHNYIEMMRQTEELVRHIVKKFRPGNTLVYQGSEIDLEEHWSRLTVADAFNQYASKDLQTAMLAEEFEEILVEEIEPHLGLPKPVFLCDYPASHGALARLKPEDPTLAERFELYIAGIELCNGFSELTDSAEQRDRFQKEQRLRRSCGKKEYPMPDAFLDVLNDMPSACGNALGIDRLVMLFADTDKIDDVVAFTPEEL